MDAQVVKAWQCIGCGKIEAPQTCVGVCQDRRVEFVYAGEHAEIVAALQRRIGELETLVRQIAYTKPRDGEWESAWRALGERARRLMQGGG
ncbi:MAG TPA: hypothetical protein VF816_12055 [Rhodocyclaceae bacterium]